jgi:hypothetical protein
MNKDLLWLIEYTKQIGNAYRRAMLSAGLDEDAVDGICADAGDDVCIWVEQNMS